MMKFVCFLLAALLLSGCAAPAAPVPETTTLPDTLPTLPAETSLPQPPETTAPILWDSRIHSGLNPDGTFDAGTLFLGDSLTFGLICQYLMPEKLLGDARFAARVGMPLLGFSGSSFIMEDDGSSVYSPEFHLASCAQAARIAGDRVTAVYFMLGTNYDACNSPESYIQAVEELLLSCPNATVYLQLIPHSTGALVYEEEVNASIREAHGHFVREGIQRVMLIDTYTGIGENLNPDGIHLNAEGQKNWYETICRFAAENHIPQ